jgi:hypothetical protein
MNNITYLTHYKIPSIKSTQICELVNCDTSYSSFTESWIQKYDNYHQLIFTLHICTYMKRVTTVTCLIW